MNRLGMINIILWKQYLYKHRYWFLLLLVTAMILRFSQMQIQQDEMTGIPVGVYAADADGERLLERLRSSGQEGQAFEQSSGSVFRFYPYEEQEAMLRDVKNGTLECGYVLPEDFFENLSEGKMRKQIILYHSASSGAHKLSYEVVFSHLFAMLSEEILSDWHEEIWEETTDADTEEWLLELKETYETGDATFSFTFEHVGKSREEEVPVLNVVRGLTGVVIFFLALLGLANCCELSGKIGAFAKHEMRQLEEWSLHIAVLGSVVAGGLFLLLTGGFGPPLTELWGLTVYFVILEVYLRILKWILRTQGAVYGAIPVLLLGSILLCPVFFRLETFVPIAGYLGKVFPVYWYLNIFI